MYKFVIWGYGKRGKRFIQNCPHEHIVAIIDTAIESGSTEDGIPFITYEKYKKEYREYDILITVKYNAEIRMLLENNKIFLYHLLEDCPPEIVGFYGTGWLDKLNVVINPEEKYYIHGLNLYTILLREFLINKYGISSLNIVSEIADKRTNAFIEKYSYIKNKKEEGVTLWGEKSRSLEKDCCIDCFDFSDKIAQYHNLEIAKFKNIYEGETCVIVATGPSLTMQDLNWLKEEKITCFGVNRIYLSFSETNWRPNFLVVSDPDILRTYEDEIISCGVEVKFVSDYVKLNKNVESVYQFHEHVLDFFPDLPKFSEDIVKGTYAGNTVVYACIQIACYMGFKRIYLLGTDHNYSIQQNDIANHFHKDYYKGMIKPDKYVGAKTELSFSAAKEYGDLHGVEIYNATRGGKLEVFPRKQLEDVLY